MSPPTSPPKSSPSARATDDGDPGGDARDRAGDDANGELGFRTGTWSNGVPKGPADVMPLHATMVDALLAVRDTDGKDGITLLPEREGQPTTHRSYSQLRDLSLAGAAALAARGIQRDERVLLLFPTSLEFVVAFLSVQMVGAIPVPCYPPFGLNLEAEMARVAHIATSSGARLALTHPLLAPFLGPLTAAAPTLGTIATLTDLGVILDDTAAAASDIPLAGVPPVQVSPTDAAFIQYTSGSTGHPKGVVLTHDNIVANLHSIGQALAVNRSDTVVSWLPLYHDMGLIGALLFSIYWRLPLVLLSPTAFLSRPHRWLRALSDYRGTLCPCPNFGFSLALRRVSDEQRQGLDLSSWRAAISGAEPCHLATMQQFLDVYGRCGLRTTAFLPVYGLAEASLAVSFRPIGGELKWLSLDRAKLAAGYAQDSTRPDATQVVSVGRAVPGQLVRVVDDEGHDLVDRRVGHVLAGGRSVMAGYFADPQATRAAMTDGFLKTGDLGFMADGELYVTGRAKDLIIKNGRNYYAADLELAAEQVPEVRHGTSVAFGDYDDTSAVERVILVCETRASERETHERIAHQVAAYVLARTGLSVDKVLLAPPHSIPKTSSGKRRRPKTRALYLAGELPTWSQAAT